MNGYRLAGAVFVLILGAILGIMIYNAGVANGIAQSGKLPAIAAGAPAAAPYPYPYPYSYYGWHPWGFGYFLPFLFIVFVFSVMRMILWRRSWYGHGCGGYESRFDEWHRQSHERMKEA